MIKRYQIEIKELKEKMAKAEAFSVHIPVFSNEILERKISGESQWIKFGNLYNGLYLDWGINRGRYRSDTDRSIPNYEGEDYNLNLFCVYINTLSIYNSHTKYGLELIEDNVDLFYFDAANTTFYVTDENIKALLDALCVWKDKAVNGIRIIEESKEIERLKKALITLEAKRL